MTQVFGPADSLSKGTVRCGFLWSEESDAYRSFQQRWAVLW